MYVQIKPIMQRADDINSLYVEENKLMLQQTKKINGRKFLEAIDTLSAKVTKILKM